jgi:pimeloyl-ACP methyl ester carboxylesterase
VLVYLRRHPEHVRAASIHGVAHTSWKYPLHHASSGQRALDMLFEECRRNEQCAAAFGDPAEDLERVMDLFSNEPVIVQVPHPERRGSVRLEVYREVLAERFRSLMYSSRNAVRIPAILQRAADSGSLGELARLEIDYQRAFQEGINWFTGMWMSITCTEDIPLITDAEVEAETAGTLFGDYRVRTHREACALWPRGEVPAGFSDPVLSEAPVLITSGDFDPVTPPAAGEAAAKHLPNSGPREHRSSMLLPCSGRVHRSRHDRRPRRLLPRGRQAASLGSRPIGWARGSQMGRESGLRR